MEWIGKDGRRIYTMVSPKPIRDSQGNIVGTYGYIMDITRINDAKLEVEAALRDNEALVEKLQLAGAEKDNLNRQLEEKNAQLHSVLAQLQEALRKTQEARNNYERLLYHYSRGDKPNF